MLYYVDKLPNFIDIGEEAENIAVNVEFDYTAWAELHGPGAAQLLVQRPQDLNPYPAVTTTADDVLSWKPTQTDTAFVGRGKIQLIYSTTDEVLEKSPIIYIMTGDSLEGAGDPPEPYEDWIDSLTDLASETLINAQAAANSADAAEDAKDDAVNAKTAAENAQLAAETAQGKAEDAADDAEASAGEAAGYASDASDYATSAYNAKIAAESAKEAIENMTVAASVDANVGTPSVDVTKTEIGGVVNIDLDFHNLKGADGVSPTNAVTDVQVAGTSVVSDHVANIPYADTSTPGVMKINPDYGIAFAGTSKFPYINAAVTGGIQPGLSAYRPIVPKYQHESAFFGLSKAAGVDLANETVTVGTYPAVSKAAIKNMLGVPDDAGDIAYDDSETYPADTVGSEISGVKSAIDSTESNLVWRYGTPTEIVAEQSVSFSADSDTGLYKHSGNLTGINWNTEFSSNSNGNIYSVTWDGTTYYLVMWSLAEPTANGYRVGVYLGNMGLLSFRDPYAADAPFVFQTRSATAIYTSSTAASHTISISRIPVVFGKIHKPVKTLVGQGTGAYSVTIAEEACDADAYGIAIGYAARAGQMAFSTGLYSAADGVAATAIGYFARASGLVATAIGYGVDASGEGQVVLGAYNVIDSNGDFAVIIGDGGTASTRHNLLTVDRSGNIVSGGKRIAFVDESSVSVSGTTPTITAEAGVRYVCGEVATLTVTVPASGIVDVVFTSGSTPTVLTVTPPTGMTMSWAGGFDPDTLEADTTYEINIMDGHLGVAGAWT